MAIMRYAFEELGFERLDTTIIESNEPSLKLFCEKCGWQKEGVKKNWYWRHNKFWNKVILGINSDDYFELINSNKYWDTT
jgi:RimJ/RimL family protein N-acetyltransferase